MTASLIFDLDGTLIDSLPDVVLAANRLLAGEGRREITLAEGGGMVGEGARPLVERAFSTTGAPVEEGRIDDLVRRFVALYRAAPAERTIVYPGVEKTLAALAADGIPLGICTNKPHEMSVLVLEALGLDRYFASVIGAGMLPVRKPDRRHLEAVMTEIGASAASAVYVGDSPTDVETARNAGVRMIAVSYGYSRVPANELGADVLIHRFDELPAALRRLDGWR